MRCHVCGARNSDDAAWCTQCYVSFRDEWTPSPPTPAPSPPAPSSPPSSAPTAADPGAARTQPPAGSSPQGAGRTDRDIRAIDGEVEWRCSSCATWVALEEPVCATCGASRVGFGDPATPSADVAEVPEQTLLGASVVLPGAGHLLAGRVGSGITRAALFLLWAAGGLWWILSTQDGRSPGIVLLVGAAVLWGATLVDANAIAKHQTVEPFGVRGLLWTVVGVTGLLMLMVAFAAAGSLGT